MKKTKLIIASLTLFVSCLYANPNFVENAGRHYDRQGNLIPPDKYYLRIALKSYQDGFNQSAYSYFKKAAAFGNTIAQKYVGLMHLKALGVSRDWSTGYAWIKLASFDNNSENKILEEKIYKLLSPQELQRSNVILEEIKFDYDQSATLKRRDTWARKQAKKVVGSYVGGQTSNVRSIIPGVQGSVDISKTYEAMNQFVDDFNYGYVSSGDIIPVEENQSNSEKGKNQ
jgi:hypothetical protein